MSKSIGRYVQLQGGFAFKSYDFKESGIPLIRISNVTLKGLDKTDIVHVPSEYETELKDFLAKKDDTLIAMSGATTGKCCFIKENDLPCLINQRVGRFKILNEKEVDKVFVYYVISSHQFQYELIKDAIGGAQPNISPKQIEKIDWDFPLFPIQRQIATILSTADAVIEKTQAAIAKYKAIKQGMLQDLFSRGIDTATGKLRPRYQDAPELYKESKLGWIPKDWEEERLGNRAVIEYGKSQKAVVSINGNIPVYGTGGLMEYATDFLFDGESILIGRKGTIDKPFYINGKFWTVDTAYYLSSFSGNVRWLHSQLEFYNLKRLNEATGVPSINREQLYNILLSFPEPKEQNEIVKRILSIDKKLQTEQDFLHKQQQIKAGLMNDLLSGKKKVMVKEEIIQAN